MAALAGSLGVSTDTATLLAERDRLRREVAELRGDLETADEERERLDHIVRNISALIDE